MYEIFNFLLCLCITLCFISSCSKIPDKEDNKLPILIFHDVSDSNLMELNTSIDYFEDILKMIQFSGLKTIFVDDVVNMLKNKNIPEKCIVITFDDAWIGVKKNASSLLEKYGMKANYFVHISGVESNHPDRINWDDFELMQSSGIWKINSHSYTHRKLTNLNDNELSLEIAKSLEILKQHELDSQFIAYPSGHVNSYVKKFSLDSGYKAGFGAGPIASITSESDIMNIPRTTMCQLFDQQLCMKKMGIDTVLLKGNILIMDDNHAKYEGDWEEVDYKLHSKPGYTLGQYGTTIQISSSLDSSCTFSFNIQRDGYYSVSFWSPVIFPASLKPVSKTNYSLYLQNNMEISEGAFNILKKNGWNPVNNLYLKKASYNLVFRKNISQQSIFVDSIKIESVQ